MSHLLGKNLIIKRAGTAIAAARSCDIDVQAQLIPVSSASDGDWSHAIAGLKSWTIAVNVLLIDGTYVTNISDAVAWVGNTYTMNVSVDGQRIESMSGTAICKQFRITGTVGNLAQGSFIFSGTGPLTYDGLTPAPIS